MYKVFSIVLFFIVLAPQDRNVTPQQFEQWKKDLNNWGRWGKDDEIGTMNLITPAKRRQAAALVKDADPIMALAGSIRAKLTGRKADQPAG